MPSFLVVCLSLLLFQLTSTFAFVVVIENHGGARSTYDNKGSYDCRRRSHPFHSDLKGQEKEEEERKYNNEQKEKTSSSRLSSSSLSRRQMIVDGPTTTAAVAGSIMGAVMASSPESSGAASFPPDVYKPAIRPTAYLVDTTIPPTLLSLKTSRQEMDVLTKLGRGSGTDKKAVFIDRVNLNNIMNKAIVGTAQKISSLMEVDLSQTGPGYASFVALGLPKEITLKDTELAESLIKEMAKGRKKDQSSALGLSFCPLSTQPLLDQYIKGDINDEQSLMDGLLQAGVSQTMIDTHKNLFHYAKLESWPLLALSPEYSDIETARTRGLQNVDTERREQYVADTDGFINLSSDPKFQLYTDRSLFKDFVPRDDKDQAGDFFAERILVHETGATALARFTAGRPDSLVVFTAPIPDVRFLGGINGRLPRVCKKVFATVPGGSSSKVTENQVTTILLNPTAQETLSLSKYLRLEIGTGPDTLQYQTKVSDYLWFSSSPKVNMIPRLME